MTLRELVFPDTPRRWRHTRWVNIAARTLHLASTGTLLGGHVFGASAQQLWPFLWGAVASGAVLIALEVAATGHWLHQGCAVAVYAKLAVLCLVPAWWDARVWLLLGVVAVASVGAHAPRTLRHYSFRFKRVMTT